MKSMLMYNMNITDEIYRIVGIKDSVIFGTDMQKYINDKYLKPLDLTNIIINKKIIWLNVSYKTISCDGYNDILNKILLIKPTEIKYSSFIFSHTHIAYQLFLIKEIV